MISRVIKILLCMLVLAMFGTFLSGLNFNSSGKQAGKHNDRAGASITERPFQMEGFSYSSYDGGRLVASIEADEFRIDRRKIWVFNLQPLKDATFKRAHLKLYLDKNNRSVSKSDGFADLNKGMLQLEGVEDSQFRQRGVVSRGIIDELTLEIYTVDQPVIRVMAKKAYIDLRKKMLKMHGVHMSDGASGRHISSPAVIWNHEERTFRIPGKYVVRSEAKVTKGTKATVGLDFSISPINKT